MRELVRRFGRDEDRVVREYAAAEERGEVERSRTNAVVGLIDDIQRHNCAGRLYAVVRNRCRGRCAAFELVTRSTGMAFCSIRHQVRSSR
jgi:hypothetical protein